MRRSYLLALVVGILAILATPLVAHAAALPKPALTLTAASTPAVGEDLGLAVSSTELDEGDVITLEKFNGLLFNAVATAPASATGTASFTVPVTSTAAVKYRVTVKASATHQAAASAQLTVTGVLPQPALTLALQGDAVVNTPTTLVATGTHLSDGETVKLEKWGGLMWGAAGTAPYDAVAGRATFPITPVNTNVVRYRVTVVKTTTRAAGVSPELAVTALASAPTPEPEAPTCGATPVTKADGTPWQCTFGDEFDADELDRTKWTPQRNWVNGRHYALGPPYVYACYIDDPAVVSQSNGTLKLTTRKMPYDVPCPTSAHGDLPDVPYASGQVHTLGTFNQEHGRFEARMKSPEFASSSPTHLHEAFWLFPDWVAGEPLTPYTGEIDISETYSDFPTLSVPTLHYDGSGKVLYTGSNSDVANTAENCVANRGEWNTYTLEWDADKLQIWVNGNLCLVNTSRSETLNKKSYVLLTSALGRKSTGYDGIDAGPKTLEVDYVHVWK